jgi:hypothetical protein
MFCLVVDPLRRFWRLLRLGACCVDNPICVQFFSFSVQGRCVRGLCSKQGFEIR